MPFTKFVEIGRVAFISFGKNQGKICAIVDVIDQNRALVDGPCSGVARHSISFKRLHLTKWRIRSFGHSAKTSIVRKSWEEDNITEKWHESSWFKRLKARRVKARLTDFDRFKVMNCKRSISHIVAKKVRGLKQYKTESLKVKRRLEKRKLLAAKKPKPKKARSGKPRKPKDTKEKREKKDPKDPSKKKTPKPKKEKSKVVKKDQKATKKPVKKTATKKPAQPTKKEAAGTQPAKKGVAATQPAKKGAEQPAKKGPAQPAKKGGAAAQPAKKGAVAPTTKKGAAAPAKKGAAALPAKKGAVSAKKAALGKKVAPPAKKVVKKKPAVPQKKKAIKPKPVKTIKLVTPEQIEKNRKKRLGQRRRLLAAKEAKKALQTK